VDEATDSRISPELANHNAPSYHPKGGAPHESGDVDKEMHVVLRIATQADIYIHAFVDLLWLQHDREANADHQWYPEICETLVWSRHTRQGFCFHVIISTLRPKAFLS